MEEIKVKRDFRKLFICIAIFILSVFFLGFFTGKQVYAAEDYKSQNLNKISEVLLADGNNSAWVDFMVNEFSKLSYIGDPYLIITRSTNEVDALTYNIHISASPLSVVNDHDGNRHRMYISHYGYKVIKPTSYSMQHQINKLEFRHVISSDYADKSLLLDSNSYIKLYDFIYSSYDVYYHSYESQWVDVGIAPGTVFFSQLTGILPPIIQMMDMNQTLKQVVFLLPLLIVLIISYLALRKVLALLRQILSQA